MAFERQLSRDERPQVDDAVLEQPAGRVPRLPDLASVDRAHGEVLEDERFSDVNRRRLRRNAEQHDVPHPHEPRLSVHGRQHGGAVDPREAVTPGDAHAGEPRQPWGGDRPRGPWGGEPRGDPTRREGAVGLPQQRRVRGREQNACAWTRSLAEAHVAAGGETTGVAQHADRGREEWPGVGTGRNARGRGDAPHERPCVIGAQLVGLQLHITRPPPRTGRR